MKYVLMQITEFVEMPASSILLQNYPDPSNRP